MASVSVAAVVVFSTFTSVANAQCNSLDTTLAPIAADTSAFYVRKLQSDMMVAALGCDMRQQYNLFATSYRAELKNNSVELMDMFTQQHGAQAKTKHTTFLTTMANDASLRMATSSGYCADAKAALAELTNNQSPTLEKVATAYFSTNDAAIKGGDDCSQVSSLPVQ